MSKEVEWEGKEIIDDGDRLVISRLAVLRSNAGYYIGRLCKTMSGEYAGLVEPYERESDYFKTEEGAELAFTEGL